MSKKPAGDFLLLFDIICARDTKNDKKSIKKYKEGK